MRRAERDPRFQLTQLALGYWRSQVLFASLDLGIFEILHDRPLEAKEVAQILDTHVDYTERLLNASVPLGLLCKSKERFSNAPLADAFLVSESPQHMGNWIRFMADCYGPWGELAEVIRSGKPARDGPGALSGGGDYTRHLTLAMHDYAMGPGRDLAERLDLSRRRRLLDVGGGPGSHSILLAQRYPELEAMVLDVPPVLEITRELIRKYGLEGRIGVRAGDYLRDDELGSGFDVVLLSNVLHQEDPDACLRVLEKAGAALVEGGLVVVQLSFLNTEKDGPLWAVLQSLQLSLLYPDGRTYSLEEMTQLLHGAGFQEPRTLRLSLLGSESVLLATKG